MRLRATVAYDGTPFQGWQSQASGETIQDHLNRAFSTVLRQPIVVQGAGRTDAGVHARGQVIAIDARGLPAEIRWRRILRSVNAILPPEISVLEIGPTDDHFDPRHDAILRGYRYRIWNAPVIPPFERYYAWHVWSPLDLEAMQAATRFVLGDHDFASFQAKDQTPRGSVRTLRHAEFRREGGLLELEIQAKSFGRMMVRNLMGAFVKIGRGDAAPEQMRTWLEARSRRVCPEPAPPTGLFLEFVRYP